MFSHVSSKRHCKVIAKSQQFTALIFKIVNQLAILSVLTRESLFKLKNRSVNFRSAVFLKNPFNNVQRLLFDSHLQWSHVTSAFCAFGSASFFISNLKDFRHHIRQLFVVCHVDYSTLSDVGSQQEVK